MINNLLYSQIEYFFWMNDKITDVTEVFLGAELLSPDAVVAERGVDVEGAATLEQQAQLNVRPGKNEAFN